MSLPAAAAAAKTPLLSRYAVGLLLAAAGAAMFAGKAVVVKLAYRHGVDAETLIALRMLAAAPFFVVALWWTSRGAPRLTGAQHGRLIVLGLLGYYLASYLDFVGLQYISASLERLILHLNPTLVLLLSALVLARPVARREWVALALCYGGIVLVFWRDLHWVGDGVLLGSVLVFASAACYAVYLVISGELVHKVGVVRLTSYSMIVSTVAVLVHFALVRPPGNLAQPAPVLWLSAINGVVCTVIPVFAVMVAVARVGAGPTALVGAVGPVTTIGLAYFFLSEPITAWQIVGTLLVLAGVYALSRR